MLEKQKQQGKRSMHLDNKMKIHIHSHTHLIFEIKTLMEDITECLPTSEDRSQLAA